MSEHRVRLRFHACRTWTEDGEVFLTVDGPLLLSRELGGWVEALLPVLDGSYSVGEIVESLPPQRRATAADLLRLLAEHRLLEPSPGRAGTALTGPYLEYLECLAPLSVPAVVAPPQVTIGLLGEGDALEWVRDVSWRAGIGVVRAVTVADVERWAPTEASGCVVVASTCTAHEARQVEELCRRRQLLLVQLGVMADELWVVPARIPDRDRPGWSDLVGRLGASTAEPVRIATITDTGSAPASLAATRAVNDVLVALNGGGDDRPGVRCHRLDTLSASDHRLVRCQPSAACLDTEPPPETDDRAPFETVTVRCMDDRTGVFTEITDRGLDQFPLNIEATSVRCPGANVSAGRATVVGVAEDRSTARRRAAEQAIAVYTVMTLAARGPARSTSDGGIAADSPVGETTAASVVFRRSAAVAAGTARPVGLAVAGNWAAAVESGLRQHTRDTALAISPPWADLCVVSPTRDPLTASSDRALLLLAAAGPAPEIRHGELPSGLCIAMCVHADRSPQLGAGLTVAEAVDDALRRVLIDHQVQSSGKPFPVDSRSSFDVPPLALDEDPAPARRAERRDRLTHVLRECGREPVVLRISVDDGLTDLVPNVAWTVLLDRTPGRESRE